MIDSEVAALDREDAGIERAAIALCWDARPALLAPDNMDRIGWWRAQSDIDRRLYLRRARVVVEEWEKHYA